MELYRPSSHQKISSRLAATSIGDRLSGSGAQVLGEEQKGNRPSPRSIKSCHHAALLLRLPDIIDTGLPDEASIYDAVFAKKKVIAHDIKNPTIPARRSHRQY
jgi:hypothetical protein